MSDKTEPKSESPKNELPQGSTNNDRPQSVYIKNSAQVPNKDGEKK
jgi:hypothetical protein